MLIYLDTSYVLLLLHYFLFSLHISSGCAQHRYMLTLILPLSNLSMHITITSFIEINSWTFEFYMGIWSEHSWIFAFHPFNSLHLSSGYYINHNHYNTHWSFSYAYGDFPLHQKQYKIINEFTFTVTTSIFHSTLLDLGSLCVCPFWCCHCLFCFCSYIIIIPHKRFLSDSTQLAHFQQCHHISFCSTLPLLLDVPFSFMFMQLHFQLCCNITILARLDPCLYVLHCLCLFHI